MKAVVEDINTVKKKIRIEIPPADIAKEREKAIADISRKAKIPGFRPGKAPKAVVERHYAAMSKPT
jgi:trigger factor